MYTLHDIFNDRAINRHEDIYGLALMAHLHANSCALKGFYLPTTIRTEDGGEVTAEEADEYHKALDRVAEEARSVLGVQ